MTLDLKIDLPGPTAMSRAHLLLRLLIAIALGGLANAIGWPGGVLYFALPAVVAVLVAQHGAPRFFEHDAPLVTRVLGWVMGFHAYMGLLTDHFPMAATDAPVRYEGQPQGAPTVGSAVLRVLTTIPAMIVLWLLSIVSCVVWVMAAVAILFVQHYPRSWFDFQCGVLRFAARVLAYHGSLVAEYPPIKIDAGPSLPRAITVAQ